MRTRLNKSKILFCIDFNTSKWQKKLWRIMNKAKKWERSPSVDCKLAYLVPNKKCYAGAVSLTLEIQNGFHVFVWEIFLMTRICHQCDHKWWLLQWTAKLKKWHRDFHGDICSKNKEIKDDLKNFLSKVLEVRCNLEKWFFKLKFDPTSNLIINTFEVCVHLKFSSEFFFVSC